MKNTVGGLAAGSVTTGGTWAGVGALGTAHTGTSIAALSGAAKTSATLAFLGGPIGWGALALGSSAIGAYSLYKLRKK